MLATISIRHRFPLLLCSTVPNMLNRPRFGPFQVLVFEAIRQCFIHTQKHSKRFDESVDSFASCQSPYLHRRFFQSKSKPNELLNVASFDVVWNGINYRCVGHQINYVQTYLLNDVFCDQSSLVNGIYDGCWMIRNHPSDHYFVMQKCDHCGFGSVVK